jgi:hypothetical protein
MVLKRKNETLEEIRGRVGIAGLFNAQQKILWMLTGEITSIRGTSKRGCWSDWRVIPSLIEE